MSEFIFWVSIVSAVINVVLIWVNMREFKRYSKMITDMNERAALLTLREYALNQRVEEAKSALMPDMREYLEEITL